MQCAKGLIEIKTETQSSSSASCLQVSQTFRRL